MEKQTHSHVTVLCHGWADLSQRLKQWEKRGYHLMALTCIPDPTKSVTGIYTAVVGRELGE